MTAIDDAFDQLRRHRGLSRVGDPVEVDGAIRIEIDIPVELPSRARRSKPVRWFSRAAGPFVRRGPTCAPTSRSTCPTSTRIGPAS